MKRLLTETAAARLLGITTAEVRQLVRHREIPVVELPIGNTVRFSSDDLVQFVATHRRDPAVPLAEG